MSSGVDLNVFDTDFKFWRKMLGAAGNGGLVNVKREVHDYEFEIELTRANGHQVMVRSSFCSSPFCRKPKEMTCAAIDARDVQSLVDEVGEINELISNRFKGCGQYKVVFF
ncbi:MAG: hypothetical protein LBF94_02160 [Puniceicoccales bacterium]|jgi:hypothetical protein|nr:hypothetical protein [Puniceicoccales bacterium]